MAWFILNPVAANLLMIFIIVAGIWAVLTLRVEGWPTLPSSTVTIEIPFPSGSPEELESAIAIKAEESLAGLNGIRSIRSKVTTETVTISVDASYGYPVDTLKEDIKSRIDAISDFPEQTERPIVNKATSSSHAISVEIYGLSLIHI